MNLRDNGLNADEYLRFRRAHGPAVKIVLSRKGFDSSSGGVPSPILPDGRLVSLPIPDGLSIIRYGDIGDQTRPIGQWVSHLTRGRIRSTSRAHLDPDLIDSDLPRQPGWRPLFGQAGAAQGHLAAQGVGPGDLFLFFGLFRQTQWQRGRLKLVPGAPRQHLIWGWMQIDEVVPVDACPEAIRRYVDYHPHFRRDPDPANTLYIARSELALPAHKSLRQSGAGVFEHFSLSRCLTDAEATGPSQWRLPAWCHPRDGQVPLSCHDRRARWQSDAKGVRLQSVARGQEFVLDTGRFPEALDWAAGMFRG
jgi:hypothetical protein